MMLSFGFVVTALYNTCEIKEVETILYMCAVTFIGLLVQTNLTVPETAT